MAQLFSLNNNVLATITPEPGTYTGNIEITIETDNINDIIIYYVNGEPTDGLEYNGPFIVQDTSTVRVDILSSNGVTIKGTSTYIYTITSQQEALPSIVTTPSSQLETINEVSKRANFYTQYHGKIIERKSSVLATRNGDAYANQDDSTNPDISALNSISLLSPEMASFVLTKKITPRPLYNLSGSPIGTTPVNKPIEHFLNVSGLTNILGSVTASNGTKLDYFGFQWCAAFASTVWLEAGAAAPGCSNTGYIHNSINPGSITLKTGGSINYKCGPMKTTNWMYWAALHGNFYQPREINNNPANVSPGSAVFFHFGGDREVHTEVVIVPTNNSIITIGGNTYPPSGGSQNNGNGLYKKSYQSLGTIAGFAKPWSYTTKYDYYGNFTTWQQAVSLAGYQVTPEIRYNYNGATLRYYRAVKVDTNSNEQIWVGGWVQGSTANPDFIPSNIVERIRSTGLGSLILT